jgi:hypothetical protein
VNLSGDGPTIYARHVRAFKRGDRSGEFVALTAGRLELVEQLAHLAGAGVRIQSVSGRAERRS